MRSGAGGERRRRRRDGGDGSRSIKIPGEALGEMEGGGEGRSDSSKCSHVESKKGRDGARSPLHSTIEAWICRNGGSTRMVSQRHRRWPGVAVRRDACTHATRLPQQRPINKRPREPRKLRRGGGGEKKSWRKGDSSFSPRPL